MNDDFIFVEEAEEPDEPHTGSWKVLIVDDEPEVHAVTKLALSDFNFHGKTLEFISAYSGKEAKELIQQHTDVAIVLLDVVMEEDDSGLKVAEYIREELHNHFCRIILRTGQPGQAPEKDIIINYDINDYKSKTELTAQKLFSVVIASLRSYNDIIVIEENRAGLQKIVESSADLFCTRSLETFIQGIVQQLSSILGCSRDAAYITSAVVKSDKDNSADPEGLYIFAGNGEYANHEGKPLAQVVNQIQLASCHEALGSKGIVYKEDHLVAFCQSRIGPGSLLYLSGLPSKLSKPDQDLVEIFARHIQLAFDNVLCTKDIDITQSDIIERLAEALERTQAVEQKTLCMREMLKVLGKKLNCSDDTIAMLCAVAPLHNVGASATPQAIIQHPAELSEIDRNSVIFHTQTGFTVLSSSKRPTIKLAATIAYQHHERWDGAGFPQGLQGDEIAFEARLMTAIDVFDKLYNQQTFKPAWPLDKVLAYFARERGKQFDPQVADCVLANASALADIQSNFLLN